MNNANMEKMLKMASGQLGMAPEELKACLSKGDVSSIMEKMNDKDAQRLKNALNNPEVEKMIKDSPEMKEYMNRKK
jgi:hypothetical protein